MTCVQNQSSKTEIANLQDTLLHQLCAQNNSLEVIRDQLENGFTAINDSLEEVFENKEQIEVSKFYERLPKPHALAVQEWLEGKIHHRNTSEE